jgi:hypothetical protein
MPSVRPSRFETGCECRTCRGPWTARGRLNRTRPPPAHRPLGQGAAPCPQPLGQRVASPTLATAPAAAGTRSTTTTERHQSPSRRSPGRLRHNWPCARDDFTTRTICSRSQGGSTSCVTTSGTAKPCSPSSLSVCPSCRSASSRSAIARSTRASTGACRSSPSSPRTPPRISATASLRPAATVNSSRTAPPPCSTRPARPPRAALRFANTCAQLRLRPRRPRQDALRRAMRDTRPLADRLVLHATLAQVVHLQTDPEPDHLRVFSGSLPPAAGDP